MARKILAAVFCTVLLLGLWQHAHRRDPGPRLVSAIEVEYGDSRQFYRDAEQMSRILNRLRALGQRYTPKEDPEALSGTTVSIWLVYSDGSKQLYQIKPDRYIRQGQSKWQQTDPKHIQSLMLLLKKSGAVY